MSLGIVLAPYGQLPNGNYPYNITFSRGGDGTYLGPRDPQFYTQGEQGYYYDTPLGDLPEYGAAQAAVIVRSAPGLITKWRMKRAMKRARKLMGMGAIPTDAEMAYNRGYTPVESGWIATTNQGNIPGPWNPPNGWLQMGAFGPRIAPRTPTGLSGFYGLGDDTAVAAAGAQAAASAIDTTLQDYQNRMFKLTIISTAIVALSATLATWRTWKQLKRDEKLFSERFRRDEAKIAANE
jgi:hypothetical protein